MRSGPRVTIGLPVYNGEPYLAESVEALLGQTYSDFELLISDNASRDNTRDICEFYANRDNRIHYVRQPHNIGIVPNFNYLVEHATGEFFKLATHDDLYARDLLKLCVEALDRDRRVVLAHSWSAVIDGAGAVVELVPYPVDTAAERAPERFRALLLDGWSDDSGGLVRVDVLRRVGRHGSYHFADRAFLTALALHGPFYIVPDWLYFRRRHSGQAGRATSVRERCVKLDPQRANRLKHPALRLYGEYVIGYEKAVRSSPLSFNERCECYLHLGRWLTRRAVPVAARSLSRRGLDVPALVPAPPSLVSIDALVAAREGGPAWARPNG